MSVSMNTLHVVHKCAVVNPGFLLPSPPPSPRAAPPADQHAQQNPPLTQSSAEAATLWRKRLLWRRAHLPPPLPGASTTWRDGGRATGQPRPQGGGACAAAVRRAILAFGDQRPLCHHRGRHEAVNVAVSETVTGSCGRWALRYSLQSPPLLDNIRVLPRRALSPPSTCDVLYYAGAAGPLSFLPRCPARACCTVSHLHNGQIKSTSRFRTRVPTC